MASLTMATRGDCGVSAVAKVLPLEQRDAQRVEVVRRQPGRIHRRAAVARPVQAQHEDILRAERQ